MLTLPGWDRQRLEVSPIADVEAARLLVYAERLAPDIRFDYAGEIRAAEIDVMKSSKQAEDARYRLRRERLAALYSGKRSQAQMRVLLRLDEPDDPEDDT